MDIADIGKGVAGFVTAIIGLAILAVVLSNGANTVGVLNSFFSGLSGLLRTVIAPVTGGSGSSLYSPSYPVSGGSYVPMNGYSQSGYGLTGSSGGLAIGTPYGSVALSGQTLQNAGSAISGFFTGQNNAVPGSNQTF